MKPTMIVLQQNLHGSLALHTRFCLVPLLVITLLAACIQPEPSSNVLSPGSTETATPPHAQGVEIEASVEVTLEVSPENPLPGQSTHFTARLLPLREFTGARGEFTLPPEFVLDPGSRLNWQGDLAKGVETQVELWATPSQSPAGKASFILNLNEAEIITARLSFGGVGLQATPTRYLPELQPAVTQHHVQPGPYPKGKASPSDVPAPLPLANFTVVEREPISDTLHYTVFTLANYDLSNATINVQLSESLELAQDEAQWKGNLNTGQWQAIELFLRIKEGAFGVLTVTLLSDQGSPQPYVYNIGIPPTPTLTPPSADASPGEGLFTPLSPAIPAAEKIFKGRFTYQEWITNTTYTTRGVYWAEVEVWNELEPGFEQLICRTNTDGNGNWQCSGTGDDPDGDGRLSLYVELTARNYYYGQVTHINGTLYNFLTPYWDVAAAGGGTVDFGVYGVTSDGAFHLLRLIGYGNYYSEVIGGEVPPDEDDASGRYLKVAWPLISGSSHYSPSAFTIYVQGSTNPKDEDEWDESVVLHEYGHYIMYMFGPSITANYCHDVGEVDPNCTHQWDSHEDINTAYLEGWADYYQSAVRSEFGFSEANWYIDVNPLFDSSLRLDLELGCNVTSGDWIDAECSNAGILWDIHDNTSTEHFYSTFIHDPLSMGGEEIFNLFSDNPASGHGTPDDMNDFYINFDTMYSYLIESLIQVYYEHEINKDTTAPTGTVLINDGAANVNTRSVTLYLNYTDYGVGIVDELRLQNCGGTWAAWEAFDWTKPWTLSSGDGTKSVCVQFRDLPHNTSTTYQDTILLDTTAPTNPSIVTSSSHSLSVWSADTTIDVAWSGASDANGVHGYSISWTQGASDIPDTVEDTTSTSATSPALSQGNTWYFHVRTLDNLGNWNSGAKHYGPFFIDTQNPTNPTSTNPGCTATNDVWQNTCSDANFTWSGAADTGGSGVAGYYYYWGTDPAGTSTNDITATAYNPGSLTSPSVRYLRLQTKDNVGKTSAWTTLFTLKYDASAPNNPNNITSSSHNLSAWSTDNTIDVSWSGAADGGGGSGLNGYSIQWSTSASTLPDTTVDLTGSSTTSSALSDGSSWYFHIRTQDNAGNWTSSAVHYGPFWIDTSAPTNPTTITSSSHTLSTWSADATIDVSWSGAADGGSGVAGYSVEWGSITTPDANLDTSSTSATGIATGSGWWYVNIRTVDNVGNWSSSAVHYGPFYIDINPPQNPYTVDSGCGAISSTWQNFCNDPSFTWSASSEGGSGVAGYYFYWGADPSGVSTNWTTGLSYNPPAVSDSGSYYLRFQTRDNVGNLSAWETRFFFRYDVLPPTDAYNIHTHESYLGQWSEDPFVTIDWYDGTDSGGSGVYGYSIVWDAYPDTIPDTAIEVDHVHVPVTSSSLASGIWYIHVRACDRAGNCAPGAIHYGPIYIDVTPPVLSNPAIEDHGVIYNVWQNSVRDPAFYWTVSDAHSGMGWQPLWYYWGTDPNGTGSEFGDVPSYNPGLVGLNSINYLRVMAVDDVGNTTPWTTLFIFRYDSTAPQRPTTVYATDHFIDQWSTDNTLDMYWSGESDTASGIQGYSFEWSLDSNTVPDQVIDPAPGFPVTSPPLADGITWYFHVKVVDWAGNWSATAHDGPYKIDATPPPNPSSATETHGTLNGVWQNTVSDPAFTWTEPSDGDGSGVYGAHRYWGTDPNGVSTDGLHSHGLYNPAMVPDSGMYFLRLQTEDRAGNLAPWVTVFTFLYDVTPPDTRVLSFDPPIFGQSYTITWGGLDLHSGIQSYDLQYRIGTGGTWTNWLLGTTLTSALFGPTSPLTPVVGTTYYFRARAVDALGNQDAYPYGNGDLWFTVQALFGTFIPFVIR
jgi:hypothetical protein